MGKSKATAPHQHWLVDITYIPVQEKFWYPIAIIDLYSRYIVGWELSPVSTAWDVERIIDFALAEWGFRDNSPKPVTYSDNGPQIKAKSLKEFSRPRVLQDLGGGPGEVLPHGQAGGSLP